MRRRLFCWFVGLYSFVYLNVCLEGDMKGNLWAWCVKTWLHWFSHTITMIKPCFNTELRVLSASPLPRDIPKINHKFTSQFPLWNCVRLQIPYQIIDRILFYSGLHFQVLCAACSFVWEDLYKFSQFFFSSFWEFVSEVSSYLLCHVTGTERESSLLICLLSQGAPVSGISPLLFAGQSSTPHFKKGFPFR